jgi:hypothetical protein
VRDGPINLKKIPIVKRQHWNLIGNCVSESLSKAENSQLSNTGGEVRRPEEIAESRGILTIQKL